MVIANERMFHCDLFFDFIGFPKNLRQNCLEHNPLSIMYSDNDFDIYMGEGNTQVSGDTKFMVFCMKIKVHSRKMKGVQTLYNIKRRYREFDVLNRHLKRKFTKYKQPLPELPPKITFLANAKNNRHFKLENYIRLLINYPDIFDCLEFRKFLNILPEKYGDFAFMGGEVIASSGGRGGLNVS